MGSSKQSLLLGVLGQLKAKDWEEVETCARRLDRPAAIAAARPGRSDERLCAKLWPCVCT